MLDSIKSDIRKLFTVRSTYILMIVAAVITIFMCFFIEAWWGKSGTAASRLTLSGTALHEIMANIAGTVATFTCIIAILQIGHEYRYNTIMYTLTASPSRLKVYFSKFLVLSVFSLVASSAVVIIGLGAYIFGLSLKDVDLPAQQLSLIPELARMAFYFLAYGVFGFLLGLLVRSLIVAITVLFILPTMVEQLLALLLRDNAKYLPMSSLDQVVNSTTLQGATLSHNMAVLVSSGYLLVLGVVALGLFLRRDAN